MTENSLNYDVIVWAILSSSVSMLIVLQVETVAQFGVVFLLFALGLEFSLTKVLYIILCDAFSIQLLELNWENISVFQHISFLTWGSVLTYYHAAKSCRSCCCSRRAASNCYPYVSVWRNCNGMALELNFTSSITDA